MVCLDILTTIVTVVTTNSESFHAERGKCGGQFDTRVKSAPATGATQTASTTRGKRLMVLIGQKKAPATAVHFQQINQVEIPGPLPHHRTSLCP
jgi:hypothetical protein